MIKLNKFDAISPKKMVEAAHARLRHLRDKKKVVAG
jgi:G3E family GTPase